MYISSFAKTTLIAGARIATSALSTTSYAGNGLGAGSKQELTGAHTLLNTYVSKSKIAGALEKDGSGNLIMDQDFNFLFTFSGDTFYPVTSAFDGKLLATSGRIGTVAGTVLFPQDFAQLAFQAYAFMTNQGPMPSIPAVIHWKMKNITINDGGTTYVPFNAAPGDDTMMSSPDELGLNGRAFTGLGPVEMVQLDVNGDGAPDMSMSVRMGGCFAVKAVDGVEAGKIGTYCLNSTFTFDLSGINLANPMQSTVTGIGSSNCNTVLQTPMQMPQ